MPSKPHRGSALVIALILITVLSVVGLALVNRTNSEIDSVSAKRFSDATASCAEAARQAVVSKFAQAGANIGQVGLQISIGSMNLYTGHYSADAGYSADGGVTTLIPASGASSGGATDAANKINKLNIGTTPYRVTVVCQDANNVSRQTEVEFVINYGL